MAATSRSLRAAGGSRTPGAITSGSMAWLATHSAPRESAIVSSGSAMPVVE